MTNFSSGYGSRDREARISRILEGVPLGIISFNADGIIDFVNSTFSKMGIIYRLKASSLIGTNIFEKEIIPDVSIRNEMNALKEGYAFEKEIRNMKIVDGSEISVIIKSSPIFENNIFTGGILVLEDLKVISESKEEDFLKLKSFQRIANKIADLFFVIDSNGFIIHSTGKKLHLISYSDPGDTSLLEKNVSILELIPNLPDDFKDILADLQNNDGEKRFNIRLDLNDDPSFYECSINSLSLKKKVSKYFICTFNDITDKVKSENLKERLNLFETAADFTSDGVIGVNAEGIINLWSPSVESLTGFSSEESSGKNLWEFIPVFNQKNFDQLKEDLSQIGFFKKEILIYDKNGNEILVLGSFLLGDPDNILISLSFPSKKTGELDFKTLEENFRSFVIKADEIVLRLDIKGIVEYINPAFISHLGFKEEEVVGRNVNEFIKQESNFDLQQYKDKPYNREIILTSKQGESVYFLASITPLYSHDDFYGFNLYLINLSEKKKEEKKLQLFRFLFENTKEGIAIENKGKIVALNKAFATLFGYSENDELIGKDLLDLADTNDVLKVAEYLQLYKTGKEISSGVEFTGKKKDGSTFFSELTLSSFESEGSKYIIIIIRDVTERKRAQQVIRESEEKYRNLIESIDDFLYTLKRGKLFFKPVFYTNSVKKITGYSQSEMLNDVKLLLKIIHPDDLAFVKENIRQLIKSRAKMSAELEFRIINKQGNVVWVRNKLNIIRNNRGEAEKIYGLVSDITLRKKAEEELQKSTQNLIKLNETKDRFISIVSHDLRTPFSSILGFTDLLLNDETLTDEEKNQYVRYIRESSEAMLQLVNSLLDWTRLQTGRIRFEPERIEASEVIANSISVLAGAAYQKNITVTSTVPDNIFIYVDKHLVGQIFNNLISNAIKFTGKGGSIAISGSQISYRFYEFSVKDTGVGIKPEDAKKLFGVDTKFTTEGTAGEKGTGLGLSLVKEIVEKHGGTISIESEQGKGSEFIFTLPVAAANILLVDANTTDRILYSKILKHITPDYDIHTAANGREALNRITSSTYALIVTENRMPLVGGYELALELKRTEMTVKPPIIILSNSVDRQVIDEYNEIGVEHVFQKPVNLSIFKQAVEKSLRQGLN